LVFQRVMSSTIAMIGAIPVPPPTRSTSRFDSELPTNEPTAGPSRTVSPSRVWCTSAVETQPPSTARTWKVSRPSARGAFAIEYGRQTRGQRSVSIAAA